MPFTFNFGFENPGASWQDAYLALLFATGGTPEDIGRMPGGLAVADASRNVELFEMQVGDMHAVEWATALSLVSWLIEQSPSKFARIVEAIKEGKSSKEAMEAVLEQDLAKTEKAWQRWVVLH